MNTDDPREDRGTKTIDRRDVETGGDPGPEELGRREALMKLGVFAAYTAPAMLTLLVSKKASADSFPPGPP